MSNFKKKLCLIIPSLFSVAFIGIGALNFNSIQNNINNNLDYKNNEDLTITSNEDSEFSSDLVPLDYDESMPLLVEETGPIISQKNRISSLDWFGAVRWTIDLTQASLNGKTFLPDGINSNTFNKWNNRAIYNFDLDKKNHILWVLSNSGNGNLVQAQRIMAVDSITGNIKNIVDLKYRDNENRLFKKIKILDSGNVMAYSTGLPKFDFYDYKTNTVTTKEYNENSLTSSMNDDIKALSNQANRSFHFLFSIAPNFNIAVFAPQAWYETNANLYNNSGNIYFAYVDDNLNLLNKDTNSTWGKSVKIADIKTMSAEQYKTVSSKGTEVNKRYVTSSGNGFPKLTYKLADGRTLFAIYNKLFVFWPETNASAPTYKEFDINVTDDSGKYRPIESWTTDTDNNIYVKFGGDTNIQKVSIKGSTPSDTDIKIETYYNIAGSNEPSIKDNAKNFVIYNVYGYSGQIMMLNPIRIAYESVPDLSDSKIYESLSKYQFGIAAAIVNSSQDAGKGDSKGLLNTDKAFLKSSTFTIEDTILQNKLPSEITRNDIEIDNDGFLTRNNERDDAGNLKYPQFKKTIMKDEDNNSNNLEITVNIDQIPWFVNNGVMPSNIPPLTITKQFKTGQKISQRVTWKSADLDYDFKNTLPSKVDVTDIQRFDPFSINIASQQTTVAGQVYPQTSYEISDQNDDNGNIKITATFKYLPLDVEANETNIKIQKFEHTYTIFKNTSKKEFNFIGQSDNSKEDIKTIPQLKNLSESNLLPSSFDSSDTSSILKFVNTDTSSGYPLSKMTFSVIPDDNNGTLTISGSLPSDYYPNDNTSTTFTKTYTGLNKISDYSFYIVRDQQSFNKKLYRPSEINEQLIYNHFVIYKGFNSSDLSLSLLPNDNDGSLTIRIHLDSSYPEIVATNSGFNKDDNGYIREEKIDGFKTTLEYKTQYEISFVNDNDISLDEIKKYTPKQIEQSLNPKNSINKNNNLTVNGSPINSEKDLAIAVISSLGSYLPKKSELSNNDNFTYNIYYNDPNGEITIKLTFKNISGTNGDLVFIQRFTGFAKGNQITTDDVLSFKTQSKLMNDNTDFHNTLPSELASKLNDELTRVEEIKKYISYYSGAYSKAIDSNDFRLEIIADDIYGYMTIKIIFDKTIVTNKDSLLSYTVTYNGFMTE